MEDLSGQRLGLILAIQAEIEGMKAHNRSKKDFELRMVYTKQDFDEKAEELRIVCAYTEMQLEDHLCQL